MDDEQIRKKRRLSAFPKVGFVCYTDKYCVFIADINDGVPEEKRYCKIGFPDFEFLSAFAFDSTLYLIDSQYFGIGTFSVYRYDLPKNILERVNFCLGTSDLIEASPPLPSPKHTCRFMRYRSYILAFSTAISFSDDVQYPDQYHDFELYDTRSGESRYLPPLTIKKQTRTSIDIDEEDDRPFELWDAKTGSFVPLVGGYSLTSEICIEAFSLIGGHSFYVQTTLGLDFKIDLDESDTGGVWEVCLDSGVIRHQGEFFVMDKEFCIDSEGVYARKVIDAKERFDFWGKNFAAYQHLPAQTIQRIKSQFDSGNIDAAIRRDIEFVDRRIPLMPMPRSIPSEMCLVEELNGACIVQVDMYKEEEECFDPDINVIFLAFDFSEFPPLDYSKSLYEQIMELIEKHEEGGEWGWAKKVKSFKLPNGPFPPSGPSIHNAFTLQI